MIGRVLAALVLVGLGATAAAAVSPEEFMRPCKRQDLIGVWRVMRLGVPVFKHKALSRPHELPVW